MTEAIFERRMTIFPKLMSDTKSHIQESQRISCRINIKITTPGHIIFKLQIKKNKDNFFFNLERNRREEESVSSIEKQRQKFSFSSENMQGRRVKYFKCYGKNNEFGILCHLKFSFKNKG